MKKTGNLANVVLENKANRRRQQLADSQRSHRQNLQESGKVRLTDSWVEPETHQRLHALKLAMGKQNIGEVLDVLATVSQESVRGRFIVELEEGVWLATGAGDPARTLAKENARRFVSRAEAESKLQAAKKFRPFEGAIIVELGDQVAES